MSLKLSRLVLLLAVAAVLAPGTVWSQVADTFARPERVGEFKVSISQSRIDAVMARVQNARLPRPMPPATGATSAWETGMDVGWLEGLRQHLRRRHTTISGPDHERGPGVPGSREDRGGRPTTDTPS